MNWYPGLGEMLSSMKAPAHTCRTGRQASIWNIKRLDLDLLGIPVQGESQHLAQEGIDRLVELVVEGRVMTLGWEDISISMAIKRGEGSMLWLST